MNIYNRIVCLICVLFLLSTNLFSQIRQADFRIHDRGQLWETMKDDGTIGAPNPDIRTEFYPSMDWPGGPHELQNKDDQRSYMYGSGIWIGGRHSSGSLFFTENGPGLHVNEGTFEAIIKRENFVESDNYNPDKAEQTIIAEWLTTENIRVRRKSMVWSFRGLNNFIIIDYVVINQNSATVSDVYIGFPYLLRPSYQDYLIHNGWGDDPFRTDDQVGYDSTYSLVYSYDHYPDYSGMEWDYGNYWPEENQGNKELRTPGYAGFALLHADEASDARPQPANVFWAQLLGNEHFFSIENMNAEDMYDLLTGEDKSLQAEPGERLTPFTLISCGPYTILPSDSIHITLVEAVNGLPLEEVIEIENEDLPDAQANLQKGLDSLKSSISRAKMLFENGYRVSAIPPPSPAVDVIPLPSAEKPTITVSWNPIERDWVNPVTGKSDIDKYRIYRSNRAFIGPYELIKEIQPRKDIHRTLYYDTLLVKWIYKDTKIDIGVSYFYAVCSVDSSENESWFTNRNEWPVKAASRPAETAIDVKVFPNPFREKSGIPTQGEENTITWTNLPEKCTIRIYTSSGELVKTIEHNNPNFGDEAWDQLTDARQRTAPGIYFWVVDSDVGYAKGSLIIIK